MREKQQEAVGIVAPRPLRDAAQRALEEHLKEFVADLAAKGRDAKSASNSVTQTARPGIHASSLPLWFASHANR